MKYRLLALDLDGTLLMDDKTISPRAKVALRSAIDRGVSVVFCTGRRYRSTIPMLEEIGRSLFIAYNNGAMARAFPEDRVILRHLFPPEHFASVVEVLERFGLDAVLHVDMFDEGIDLFCKTTDANSFHQTYVGRNKDVLCTVEELQSAPADKVIQFIVIEKLYKLLAPYEALHKMKTDGSLNVHIVRNLTIPASALEILHCRAEKWETVSQIAESLGIGRKQIVAIGDDVSDLGLIENAALGIAVQNAISEVKEAAALVVPSNNDDGAAIAIERFFL